MRIKHEFGELYYRSVDGRWYIDSIFVNQEHRNEGIGSWLMNVALRSCGRPILLFATNELGGDMKRLKKFYKSFGFEPIRQGRYDTFPYKFNMILEREHRPGGCEGRKE